MKIKIIAFSHVLNINKMFCVFKDQDNRIYSLQHVKSSLIVGDQYLWISWVIVSHEFTSQRTITCIYFFCNCDKYYPKCISIPQNYVLTFSFVLPRLSLSNETCMLAEIYGDSRGSGCTRLPHGKNNIIIMCTPYRGHGLIITGKYSLILYLLFIHAYEYISILLSMRKDQILQRLTCHTMIVIKFFVLLLIHANWRYVCLSFQLPNKYLKITTFNKMYVNLALLFFKVLTQNIHTMLYA
jgi:hypothetical protein